MIPLIIAFLSFYPAAHSQDLKVVSANNQFGFEFYKQSIHGDSNLFFSPISLETALAMTSAGAEKETLQQMTQTLKLEGDYHSEFKSLSEELKSSAQVEILIANHLWGPVGSEYKSAFLSQLKQNYGAEITSLDFKNKTEEARNQINHWAAENTKNKIKDLIPFGVLGPATDFVLTNAIYFKGAWSKAFDKSLTKDSIFKGADSEDNLVSFMNATSKFRFSSDQGNAMVELPYFGEQIVMDVILPNENTDLKATGKNLSFAYFQKLLNLQTLRKVIVGIPKFKIESNLDLGDQLSKMGMPLAFDGQKADFNEIRKIQPGENIFISKVIQKSFIETNEQGSEAAAVTAVTGVRGMALKVETVPVFKADRPFIFLIRHKASGAILFMGRHSMPTES